MNKVICFDQGAEEEMATVFQRIFDVIAQSSRTEALVYQQKVLHGAATIEEYLAKCNSYGYPVYPLGDIVSAAPQWLEIVFEAGENAWVCGGAMLGLDADDLNDDQEAIEAFCEANRRQHEEGKQAWAQQYEAKKASLPVVLDAWSLTCVQETFRGDLMFHLISGRKLLQQLADFDQIIESINEHVRCGEVCTIELIDWIEESESLGTIELLKLDRSTLSLKKVDVQAARKIRRHLISDLRKALVTFYTVIDTAEQWKEQEW